jgi:hypothetical protein
VAWKGQIAVERAQQTASTVRVRQDGEEMGAAEG